MILKDIVFVLTYFSIQAKWNLTWEVEMERIRGRGNETPKCKTPFSTGSGWCMADSDSNLTSDDLHHTNWTVDVRTPSREWGGPTIIDLHELTVLYFWYSTPIFKHIAMRYTFTRARWLRAFKREISPAVYPCQRRLGFLDKAKCRVLTLWVYQSLRNVAIERSSSFQVNSLSPIPWDSPPRN